jgi:hypothetical protein
MVSVKESKWIEFDIINAAVVWLDRPEKNFGLVVEVENEDNDPLDPSDYFANLACPGTLFKHLKSSSIYLLFYKNRCLCRLQLFF